MLSGGRRGREWFFGARAEGARLKSDKMKTASSAAMFNWIVQELWVCILARLVELILSQGRQWGGSFRQWGGSFRRKQLTSGAWVILALGASCQKVPRHADKGIHTHAHMCIYIYMSFWLVAAVFLVPIRRLVQLANVSSLRACALATS